MKKEPNHLAHYYVLATKENIYKDEIKIDDLVMEFRPVRDDFVIPDQLDLSLNYYYITIDNSVDIKMGFNNPNIYTLYRKNIDRIIVERFIQFVVDQTFISEDVYVFHYVIPSLEPYTKEKGIFDNIIVYESLDFILPEDNFFFDRRNLYKFTYSKYNEQSK